MIVSIALMMKVGGKKDKRPYQLLQPAQASSGTLSDASSLPWGSLVGAMTVGCGRGIFASLRKAGRGRSEGRSYARVAVSPAWVSVQARLVMVIC